MRAARASVFVKITYKSRFLTWGEVWYDNEWEQTPVDCLIYLQRSAPIPGAKGRELLIYLIDLQQEIERLKANLKGDTWRKIRRAGEQDKIVIEHLDSKNRKVLDRFEQFYNGFAAQKGMNPIQRWRLEGLAAAGVLDLSAAKDPNGETLVYHVNYRDDQHASGINSVSLFRNYADSAFRNMIGRANCYLTWSDFLRYKKQGLKSFDFGGWYQGNDPTMLSINRFKTNFGGHVMRKYECLRILTLKGWIVLKLAQWFGSRKSIQYRPDIQMPKSPEIIADFLVQQADGMAPPYDCPVEIAGTKATT